MTEALEKTDPKKFANFLVLFAENPDRSISKIAKACGIPQQTANEIVKRIETRYLPALNEVKRATTPSLVKKLDTILPLLLDGFTKEEIDKAGLRDKAVAFGIMIEKRQLLMGEPTQIMTFEERKSMNELAPALLAEIKKRELAPIDVEYKDITDPVTGANDPQ